MQTYVACSFDTYNLFSRHQANVYDAFVVKQWYHFDCFIPKSELTSSGFWHSLTVEWNEATSDTSVTCNKDLHIDYHFCVKPIKRSKVYMPRSRKYDIWYHGIYIRGTTFQLAYRIYLYEYLHQYFGNQIRIQPGFITSQSMRNLG